MSSNSNLLVVQYQEDRLLRGGGGQEAILYLGLPLGWKLWRNPRDMGAFLHHFSLLACCCLCVLALEEGFQGSKRPLIHIRPHQVILVCPMVAGRKHGTMLNTGLAMDSSC